MMGARTALSRAGARRRTPPHEACGRSAARTLAEKLDCRLCRPLGWVVLRRIIKECHHVLVAAKEPTALSGGRLPAGHRTVSQWFVHGAALTSVAAVSPPAGARTALLPTTPVTANEHFSAVSPAPVCTDEYGIAIRTSYDEDNHYLYAHYCYCYGSGVNERRIPLKYLPDYIKQ